MSVGTDAEAYALRMTTTSSTGTSMSNRLAPRSASTLRSLSPQEIRQHHPLRQHGRCPNWSIDEGRRACRSGGGRDAMAAGAKQRGAEIRRRCRVTGITRTREGLWHLSTNDGDILAEHVVNAAGCYARAVQAMVGGEVPLANMLHHYVVTEPIKELIESEHEFPVVRDPHASCYIAPGTEGRNDRIYELVGATEAWDGCDPRWEDSNELFDPAYDRIAPWLELALQAHSALCGQGTQACRARCNYATTPDSNPLVGPAPGLDNFWMCCGSSIGIAQGGGAGKYLAQWMVHGAADINMAPLDPRRYGDWTTLEYTRAKSIQDYGLMYACPLPGEELPAGRPARCSTLYEKLCAKGAEHTEAAGWEAAEMVPQVGDSRETKLSPIQRP